MRAWKKTLLALLSTAIAVTASGLGTGVAFADDPVQPPEPQAQATQAAQTSRANAAVVPLDQPDFLDTAGALAGGLLAIGLAAVGLTITFRSLAADVKGRRHRYRRRVRRSPHPPADA